MANLRSFGGTTAEAVQAFAHDSGLTLPPDYVEFLVRHNGGVPDPAVSCFVPGPGEHVLIEAFFGVGRGRDFGLESWLDEYHDEMPAGSLIVADGAGMLFILVPAERGDDAGVYCWDHAHQFPGSSEEGGNTYFVAPSFGAFFEKLAPIDDAPKSTDAVAFAGEPERREGAQEVSGRGYSITVPQVGPFMELRLIRWRVPDGRRVSVGDVICELETEKATAEIEASQSGTLGQEVAAHSTLVPRQVIGRITS